MIHQSANRPNQILGGDRELVLVTMLTAVSLAFSLGTLVGIRSGRCVLGRAQWRFFNGWARPIRCCGRSTCGTSAISRSIRQRAACTRVSANAVRGGEGWQREPVHAPITVHRFERTNRNATK